MKGVAVRGVNIGDVRVLQIAVPPIAEQEEIARRVEGLMRLANAIEKRVGAATMRAEKLGLTILAKAFRGELVPTEAELARREGREYEPASVLLDRIANETAAAQPKPRKSSGRKSTRKQKN
jgi:type I restriction enzyme S subunit